MVRRKTPEIAKGILWLVAAAFFSLPAWAGPPFETDDPEPTDFRHWEIYLGSTAIQMGNDFWGTAPFLELNYGAFPDTQLSLTQQAAFNFSSTGGRYFGYGDTLAGIKYRFLHESAEIPQAAFFPQVNLPTGNAAQGLGFGQTQVLLPLWLQKSWGPWTTYGGEAIGSTPVLGTRIGSF